MRYRIGMLWMLFQLFFLVGKAGNPPEIQLLPEEKESELVFWEEETKKLTGADLLALDFSGNGEVGVAVGKAGTLLEYRKGTWSLSSFSGKLSSHDIRAVWMGEDGLEAWAVGDSGTLLKRTGSEWRSVNLPGKWSDATFTALGFSPLATRGLVLGHIRDVPMWLEYRTGKGWREWAPPQFENLREGAGIRKAWFSEDLKHIVLVPGQGRQHTLHYDKGKWERHWMPLPGTEIRGLDFSEEGEQGWAVGTNGLILKFENGLWQNDYGVFRTSVPTNRAVWFNPARSEGWILGDSGRVFRYGTNACSPRGPGWNLHPQDARLGSPCHAVWVDEAGKSGFATGSEGRVASLRRVQPSIQAFIFGDREKAGGELVLYLEDQLRADNYPFKVLDLKLFLEDGFGNKTELPFLNQSPQGDSFYFKLPVRSDSTTVTLRGENRRLNLKLAGSYGPQSASWTFLSPLYAVGPTGWGIWLIRIALIWLAMATFLPLVLLWSKWGRRCLLDAQLSWAAGLILGKFIWNRGLLRNIKPLRKLVLREFFQNYPRFSRIDKWNSGETYIAPDLIATPPSLELSAENQAQWKSIFREFAPGESPKLVLVKGNSGIGKSALLENWARFALEINQHPILLDLGDSRPFFTQLKEQFRQFGNIRASETDLMGLLAAGGFTFLLDAANESADQHRINSFVQKITKDNVLILSTQSEFDWMKNYEVRKIHPQIFGLRQLEELLGDERAKALLSEPGWSSADLLPQNIVLLSNYLKSESNELPASPLVLFSSFELVFNGEENLKKVRELAWELFQKGEKLFVSGEDLSEEWCEAGRSVDLFNKSEGKYRFRHQRFLSFFVARYLENTSLWEVGNFNFLESEPRNLDGFADVIEFWARLILNQPSEPNNRFLEFALDICRSHPDLYRQRLGPIVEIEDRNGNLSADSDYFSKINRALSSQIRRLHSGLFQVGLMYAPEEEIFVRAVREELAALRVSTFFPPEYKLFHSGENHFEKTMEMMRNQCKYVVVFTSVTFPDSEYGRHILEEGGSAGPNLLSIRMDEEPFTNLNPLNYDKTHFKLKPKEAAHLIRQETKSS